MFLGMTAHLREWSNEMLTVALKRKLMARMRHIFLAQNPPRKPTVNEVLSCRHRS
jgi:hypothetical protein